MTAALVALAIATAADIVTTIVGMRRGFRETMPIARGMMKIAGHLWWVLKIAATAALAALMILILPDELDASAIWGFAVAIAAAAATNLYSLSK